MRPVESTVVRPFEFPGAADAPILGDLHVPADPEMIRGVVLLMHGFKGYKDYGMFPRIAERLAEAGYAAVRFNFSHSGMTNRTERFERPDLFEADTWNRQVEDLQAVLAAITGERLALPSRPVILFGHSRGGVTAILGAGRLCGDDDVSPIAGVVTAGTPSTANPLNPDQCHQLREQGYLESPSGRTGQTLRIGRAFLEEQLAEPEAHDVLHQVGRLCVPLLALHGEVDATINVEAAHELVAAADDGRAEVVPAADHVFNTPNPLPPDRPTSVQLQQLIDALIEFADERCPTR